MEIHCLLCHSSAASRPSAFFPAFLLRCVQLETLSSQQALSFLQQTPDESAVTESIKLLTPILSAGLVEQAVDMDSWQRPPRGARHQAYLSASRPRGRSGPAMWLGCARKYVAMFNGQPPMPITSLRYFTALIEEVRQTDTPASYWQHVILFGEGSLKRALNEFIDHFHSERNHQGRGESHPVSRGDDNQVAARHGLPRAPRRPASILLTCCMIL